jgi:SnoaL-like domain
MTYSLEEIGDRLAINDTIIRYVHALDDHEIDVLDTVFLPECQIDFSSIGGPTGTWTELKPTLYANLQHTCTHDMHFFGMSRITFLDAERSQARVKSKVINPIAAMHNGREVYFQLHGSYGDLFVKLPEGWRIRERTWNFGWISGENPYEGSTMGEARKPQTGD